VCISEVHQQVWLLPIHRYLHPRVLLKLTNSVNKACIRQYWNSKNRALSANREGQKIETSATQAKFCVFLFLYSEVKYENPWFSISIQFCQPRGSIYLSAVLLYSRQFGSFRKKMEMFVGGEALIRCRMIFYFTNLFFLALLRRNKLFLIQ